MMANSEIVRILRKLSAAFAAYQDAGSDFCTFCYNSTEIEYLRTTAVSDIDREHARRLLWEAADHWESSEVYRHYLPRILHAIAPPEDSEDLYPEHLFEVLSAQGFAAWPEVERDAVLEFVDALAKEGTFTAEDARSWTAAAERLRRPQHLLP